MFKVFITNAKIVLIFAKKFISFVILLISNIFSSRQSVTTFVYQLFYTHRSLQILLNLKGMVKIKCIRFSINYLNYKKLYLEILFLYFVNRHNRLSAVTSYTSIKSWYTNLLLFQLFPFLYYCL